MRAQHRPPRRDRRAPVPYERGIVAVQIPYWTTDSQGDRVRRYRTLTAEGNVVAATALVVQRMVQEGVL